MSEFEVKHMMFEVALALTMIVFILCQICRLDATTTLLIIIITLLLIVIDILNCLLEKIDTELLRRELAKEVWGDE